MTISYTTLNSWYRWNSQEVESPTSVQGHCISSKSENQIPSLTAMNFWDLSIIIEEPHCLRVRRLWCQKDYLEVKLHARSTSVMFCKHTECPAVAWTVTQWLPGMSPYSGGAYGQGQLRSQIYIENTEYNIHAILPFTSSSSSETTATSAVIRGRNNKIFYQKNPTIAVCHLPFSYHS